MKTLLVSMAMLAALSGCISSSSPPPPQKTTTVVVPQGSTTTVVCQNGTQPPCN
jgi:ABC-type Fe3+-hydroxamate transport system substrate-binding protein